MGSGSRWRRGVPRVIDALGYAFGVLLVLGLAINAFVLETATARVTSGAAAVALAVVLVTMARRHLRS